MGVYSVCQLLTCNSNSFVNEIHSICPEREREITQSTKRQDTQPIETLAGKIEIQNRENEPTKSKWGWSDLNDLTPKPSQHKKGISRDRNDSYAKLEQALDKHETPKAQIDLQKVHWKHVEERQGRTKARNPRNWNDKERLGARRQDDQDPMEPSSQKPLQ